MKALNFRSFIATVMTLTISLALVLPNPVLAYSNGPRNGGTFADDASIGTVTWTSPANAQYSDNIRASAILTTTYRVSHYLKATNFGFNIPGNATIQGIQVDVERSVSGGTTLITASA
jgi:hypothetical protein